MKFDYNNIQNMDINKMMKYLIFISFATQWSLISMILNLFTMGLIRIPLFILLIIDALSMLVFKEKTVKRPSFLLSKLWDLIEYIQGSRSSHGYSTASKSGSVSNTFNNVTNSVNKTKNKIKNIFNNINSIKINNKKYNKERELNKFSSEIGKKITVEYTSQDNKLQKKTFEYKDRATTYIKMLESKGYKNYTKYNINPTQTETYIIFNKNKDIIDIENNKIQLKKQDKNYKYVVDGWPKK
ncbi:hypothetical protein PXD04_09110 [Methanosphaera sp. ISO3-F5]|uniref:hypothetical protein n=1 Tax=Methanosphaera sp. ISO3-F5 TaxID=1452353 RepID=UPI002B25FBA5|nr:hypothetical protein [Methanosphaera sp. ISO3-F5]WQH63847.1 hypothetical protein PXD04_09110 [Methanosphaera sp. ISO3-F5]